MRSGSVKRSRTRVESWEMSIPEARISRSAKQRRSVVGYGDYGCGEIEGRERGLE